MEVKPTGFIVACKKFFGFKPGQTLREFKTEVKELTQADRDELAPLLAQALGEPVEAGTAS